MRLVPRTTTGTPGLPAPAALRVPTGTTGLVEATGLLPAPTTAAVPARSTRGRFERQVIVIVPHGDLDPGTLLDLTVQPDLRAITHRDRDPRGPRASRPTDPVHIRLRIQGHVEVDHVGDVAHIDPTRRDIRRNEHAHLPALEVLHRLRPRVLVLVPVDRSSTNTLAIEVLRDLVRAVLRLGEHEHPLDLLPLQDPHQQRFLVLPIERVDPLRDRIDRRRFRSRLDQLGLRQHRVSERPDLLRDRRGEQQRLTILAHHRDDLPHVVDEPHVEHPIRFVEHQQFDLAQIHLPLIAQVHQTTRGRDQHIDPRADRRDLLPLVHPTEHHSVAQLQVLPVRNEAIENLLRKLARRRKHERPRVPTRREPGPHLVQDLEHRERERARLPRPRLRRPQDVRPLQRDRNRSGLDRRRFGVALVGHRANDGLVEPQFSKLHMDWLLVFPACIRGIPDRFWASGALKFRNVRRAHKASEASNRSGYHAPNP